ncbi:MAG: transporter substrate-binding protein [Acidimicrobiales bacterium]|nr:transporter substrate-binding protein [Acidimicrobiales bacterium]
MSRSHLIRAGSAVAILALGAAACGGSSKNNATTGNGTGKAVSASYNAAVTGIVNASTKTGGQLNYVAVSDFDSLDPARTYYAYSWNFQRIYQRTLLMFNPVPGPNGAQVTGDLATGKGTYTDGGKTVSYTLRDGITFEDGTPITSADIKYALERSFAEDVINGGPGATYLKPVLVGATAYKGPYKDKAGLASIDASDPKKISFKLSKAFTDFDYLMALPISTPVPQKSDTGARYQFHPVSSGPYKIASYQPGKSLKLVRNDKWNKASDPNRKALPDTIVVTEGLTSDDEDARLLNGSADMEIEGTGVQPTAVSKILANPTNKANADNPSTGFTRYISIQEKVAPFDNIHCRKAVQYAADKVALQFSRGGPVAGGDFASQMLPPNLPAYKKFDLYPSGPDHKGDIAKAKDELKQCGKPNGFKTKIATANTAKGIKTAVALQEGLKRAGIDAEVVQVDSATYYSGFIGVPDNVHKRGLGLAVAGWGADFPTEYGFFASIVDGRNIKAAGNSDYAEFSNPKVGELIDKALASTSVSERNDLYGQVDKLVMESADFLPFVADKALDYRNPRLSNVYINQAFGQYDLVNIGVTS